MKNHSLLSPIALALLAAAPISAAYAQTSQGSTDGMMMKSGASMTAVAPADQMFFKKAAIGGMTEVEAGKLAAAQGSSADVKTFGQKMVDDHTKAGEQLSKLAMSKGVTLPAAPDAKHEAMLTALKGKQGADFDSAFVADMKMGHAEAIKVYTAASQSKDPEIASLATSTLPTLKEHASSIPMTMPGNKMGAMQ